MIYSSPEFMVFFFGTTVAYFLAGQQRLRFWLLIAWSLFFYSWAGFFDFFIFLLVTLVSWLCAALAEKSPKHRNALINAGILVLSVHLVFWKYAPWLVSNIQDIAPRFMGGRKLNLPLPLGISFYTFQGIAYLVDFKRRDAELVGFPTYLLFKSFFAQIVAGPIVRAQQLVPQLERLERPRARDLRRGLILFAVGLFKKIVVADRLGAFIAPVFLQPEKYGRGALLVAGLGYTVQIWSDFSGYTDMGRGAARILGISLPENFLSPYLARSPVEFWRRWHVTLGEWIRDYVYIPLGGNRGSRLRTLCVLMLTLTLCGLWHGSGWNFLFWGVYQGILICLYRLLNQSTWAVNLKAFLGPRRMNWLSLPLMFVLSAFGMILVRLETIRELRHYFHQLVFPAAQGYTFEHTGGVALGLVFCFVYQIVTYYDLKTKSYPFCEGAKSRAAALLPAGGIRLSTRRAVFAGLAGGLVFSVFLISTLHYRYEDQPSPFIYFRF